jgi:radical SAM superfamily enzyme YgiQ (UPF0313 family)
MRVALIYPPPWKIAAPGGVPFPVGQGPPAGREEMTLGGDFLGPPYGLMLLDAQLRRKGFQVTTLNLADFPWPQVEEILRSLEADLYGLTSLTANRRGLGFVVELIRQLRPTSHIVVGGPHASALPTEMLQRLSAIDTVVVGEGEATLLQLCHRLDQGISTHGIKGTAWRQGGEIRIGSPRAPTPDLDDQAPLHEWFASPFLITSRGCPGRCVFCGSRAMWGRGLRFHSVGYVLDVLETLQRDHGLPLIGIKDDTFTANRSRAREICQGILERHIDLLWICDTRADCVDAETLRAMRLAGCQQISLGVESGSPQIIKRLGKRITLEMIRNSTRMARSLGIIVRWYVILGSPGETLETLEQTFELIRRERPHQVVFTPFSTYPGTPEFGLRHRRGELSIREFFERDFWTPTFFFDVSDQVRRVILDWLTSFPGIAVASRYSSAELRSALGHLPGSSALHMDLATALAAEGQLDEAEEYIDASLEMGYPLPAVGHNLRAVIAAKRSDSALARHSLEVALRGYPFRHVLRNQERLSEWEVLGDGVGLDRLELEVYPSFEIAEEARQPMNPGPVDRDLLA